MVGSLHSRWVVAVALIGAAIVGVFALQRWEPVMYEGWPLDPSAAHVIPRSGSDAAVLETYVAPGSMAPGMEGAVLFVRLRDPSGNTVLDTWFDWPQGEERVPPGQYSMVAYWRTCGGNCSNLGRESPFCTQEIDVAPRDRVRIVVSPTPLASHSTCRVEQGAIR